MDSYLEDLSMLSFIGFGVNFLMLLRPHIEPPLNCDLYAGLRLRPLERYQESQNGANDVGSRKQLSLL